MVAPQDVLDAVVGLNPDVRPGLQALRLMQSRLDYVIQNYKSLTKEFTMKQLKQAQLYLVNQYVSQNGIAPINEVENPQIGPVPTGLTKE